MKKENKVKAWKSYHESLIEDLKNPEEAAEYLNETLEGGDYRLFLVALRNVAQAHGGLLRLSRISKLSRPNLYRMLSKTGRPEIRSLHQILKVLGLKLSVTTVNDLRLNRAA